MSVTTPVQAAHHGRGGCGLVHLVLGSLDFGLQMRRWVEVLALFPGATTLDVIHAHGDSVVIVVNHGAVCRVGEATVVLTPGTVPSLILPAHLDTRRRDKNNEEPRHKFHVDSAHELLHEFTLKCVCVCV